MRYVFVCENCALEVEFYRSIHEGPPKDAKSRSCPECDQEMWHDLGDCNFILRGEFPGKSITRDNERTTTAGKAEKMFHEHGVAKKEADDVLAERRKGTNSFKEYEKHNRAQVKRYWSNRKKGIVDPK